MKRRSIPLFVTALLTLGLGATASAHPRDEGTGFITPKFWVGQDGDDTPFDFKMYSALGRPKLGVQIMQLTPELREHFGAPPDAGVMVAKVFEDSAAAEAGIQVGDIIVEIAGEPVQQHHVVMASVAKHAGEEVEIQVVRKGRTRELTAKLPEVKKMELRELPSFNSDALERMEQRLLELEDRIKELESER